MLPSRAIVVWALLALAMGAPIAVAATSPLLAWREPIYIAAGLAGVFGLALMLAQPLLALGLLPGADGRRGRRLHAWIGGALAAAVAAHVAGLWLTSPPDVVDALLFRSPTPFSAWGVVAMWAVFAAALFAALRRRLKTPHKYWRAAHLSLASITVAGTVAHALLIEGTMGTPSKIALCVLVAAAALATVLGGPAATAFRARRLPPSATGPTS